MSYSSVITCVLGDDVDLVSLDHLPKLRLRLEVDDPTAQLRCHLLDVILAEVEFISDLLVRQVDPHQVEAQDQLVERLVVREDRLGQIVEVAVADLTVVALALLGNVGAYAASE